MAEIPSTHYVKSDDVHIAYQVLGEGSFELLFVPGFVSNIEAIWQSPEQSAFFRRLASFSRLILFDKRGTGMSDRGSQIFTLEQRMHVVRAILDELAQSEHHSSELPKAAQCPFFMPQLIPNARPHWSYMVPMPDDRGLPIILSVGRTNSGNVYLTISNAIGANHSREAWQRV